MVQLKEGLGRHPGHQENNFNSFMVQLKVPHSPFAIAAKTDFNSFMVQLKEDESGKAIELEGEFQFLYGTIKRRLTDPFTVYFD